ncbi:hypothetical protein [Clostridium ihumii]|nr:hypothetical protein [Clostridium ihumii]
MRIPINLIENGKLKVNAKIGFPISKNDFLLSLQSKLVENNIET